MPTPRIPVLATLILLLLSTAGGPASAEPYAAQLNRENLARLRLSGTDAIAGLDDWALGDGVICAAISDPKHESDFSTSGGSLVDLGRCGRADDQLVIFDQLRNLSLSKSVPITAVAAHEGPGWARIDTHGESDGAVLETSYSVDTARPGRLRIATRLTRQTAGEGIFGLGGAFANAYTLRPFLTSLASPGRSRGFVGPAFLGLGAGAIAAAAVAADTAVLVGESSIDPGVSYGARVLRAERIDRDGERIPLPVFMLADDMATVIAVFSDTFWLGGESALGWPQLLQTRLMDLGEGDAIAYELELVVGDRADVASALDQLIDGGVSLGGRVDDPQARIRIDVLDGAPVTEIRPASDGRFQARVRAGEYRMVLDAPGGRQVARQVRVGAEAVDVGVVPVGVPAQVRLPRGQTMRLTFVGEDGTPDPRFGDDLLGFDVTGKEIESTALSRDLSLSGTTIDPERIAVAPGRYRVYATRGIEYEVNQTTIEARAGEITPLTIEPPARAFATPGWISADFHVHGARSLDSALSADSRLGSFVAEGAEVLVSTDHDAVTDYGPRIRALGLQTKLATVVGLEVTSEARTKTMPHTLGHANAFPYRADPLAYRDGVPRNEGRRWREVIPELRVLPGERVIQLNHARYPGAAYNPRGFFTHLGFVGEPYNPTQPLTAWPNRVLIDPDPATGARDIDFDAMEILNGKRMESYPELRADWFSLLQQGLVLTGTANSDSHNLGQIVALPRNYVAMIDDRIAGFDAGQLVRSVRAQRVFGTTGPFVEVDVDGSGMGERFRGSEGTLRVGIKAAPWILLRRLNVLVGGKEVVTRTVSEPGEWQIPLSFAADTFVTVEVWGEPGPTYAAVLPGFTPMAFTNPIFIDADGDGQYRPVF